MSEVFVIDPTASFMDFIDAIDMRFTKAQAIVHAVLFSCFDDQGELNASTNTIVNSLWAVEGLLDEITELKEALYKMRKTVKRGHFMDR